MPEVVTENVGDLRAHRGAGFIVLLGAGKKNDQKGPGWHFAVMIAVE